jgi:hypothetical protein
MVVWLEEEGGARLCLDVDWGRLLLLTLITGDPALGVAAAGEAENEDENALACFHTLAASTAADCLELVTGVPLRREDSLAAQTKSR